MMKYINIGIFGLVSLLSGYSILVDYPEVIIFIISTLVVYNKLKGEKG